MLLLHEQELLYRIVDFVTVLSRKEHKFTVDRRAVSSCWKAGTLRISTCTEAEHSKCFLGRLQLPLASLLTFAFTSIAQHEVLALCSHQ
jgi:hypothetical protein